MGSITFYVIPVMNAAVSLITIESTPIEYDTLGVFCHVSFSFVNNGCINIWIIP